MFALVFIILGISVFPELSKLHNYMMQHNQPAKWQRIGSLLGLSHEQLDVIDRDCKGKAEDCNTAMLSLWLNLDSTASWEKFVMVMDEVSKPTFASVDYSTISNVKAYLQKRYDARYTKPLEFCLPYKSENFTNIAFIEHDLSEVTEESITAVANVMYNGDIIIDNDESYWSVERNKCYYQRCKKSTDIFEFLNSISSIPNRKPFLLLIEGAPGMGKTIICKEMASHVSKNQNNELTFLINLYETNAHNINSFEAFLKYTCSFARQKEFEKVSDYLGTIKGKSVLVIIDGYEQLFSETSYSININSFIMDIINHKVLQFQQCDLIVSTRHAALIDLNQHENCYRIELLGFTEHSQQQYIESSLENSMSQNDVTSLKNYIKSNPVVRSLCFHPLFINYLVLLYQEIKIMPNLTELINRYVCIIILWTLQNQQVPTILNITSLFEKLPKNCQYNLIRISHLAFYSLQEGKVVFELEKKFGQDVCELVISVEQSYQVSLGFIKAFTLFEISGKKKMFTFSYSVMQKFLAAYFIIVSENNAVNLWTETNWSSRYINVWAYYFGLAKAVRKEFKDVMLTTQLGIFRTKKLISEISQNKIKCLYLVYCLMGLPDEQIFQQAKCVVLTIENTLDVSNHFLNYGDLHMITLLLSSFPVQHWKYFKLSNCYLDEDKLEYFVCQFQRIVKSKLNVDTVDFSDNLISVSVNSINMMLKFRNLVNASKILIPYYPIAEVILETTLPFTKELFGGFIMKSHRSVFLCGTINESYLHSFGNLTNLYIIRCSLNSEIVKHLVNAFRTSNLSLLCFYDNGFLHDDVVKIFDVLMDLKQLTSIMVFEKSISEANMDKICSTLSLNNTIVEVLLVNVNKLLAQGINSNLILMALEYSPSIVHLQLNDCHITNSVMIKVAKLLLYSSIQWKVFDLSDSRIGEDELEWLYGILHYKIGLSITSVKLCNNQLTSLSLIAKIIWCLNPKFIDISKNNITIDNGRLLTSIQYLFTDHRKLSLCLTCDNDNIVVCHNLDQNLLDAKFINLHNLTQLLLNNCSVNEGFLINSLQNCKSLVLLAMHNFTTQVADDISAVINNNPLLQTVILGNNKFKTEGIIKIASSLKNIRDVRLLQLGNNGLTDKAANAIADVICSNTKVELIFLDHNNLRSYGTKVICSSLMNITTLKLLELANNCITKEAADDLASVINNNTMMYAICLGNNKLGTEGVITISNALKNINSLTELSLNNNYITDRAANAIADVIHSNTKLEKLILNNNSLQSNGTKIICKRLLNIKTLKVLLLQNNSITEEAADDLSAVIINNPLLENFDVSNNKITSIGITKVMKALTVLSYLKILSINNYLFTYYLAYDITQFVKKNYALEEVLLSNNLLVPLIIDALQNLHNLKLLQLSNNGITTQAADGIAAVINNNILLQTVTLGNNKLGTEGVITIANALKNIRDLRVLGLDSNCITDKAANVIADVIYSNTKLEKLFLNDNNLQSHGTKVICKSLMNITTLKVLELANNCITKESADDLAVVINNNPLMCAVCLENNKLETEGVIKMADALKNIKYLKILKLSNNCITDKAASAISDVICRNTELEQLLLNNNNLQSNGIKIICTSLMHISVLKMLLLQNNSITEEAAGDLSAVIINNPFLENFDVSNNKINSVGIAKVVDALKTLPHLKALSVNNNQITDDAANDIVEIITNNSALEEVWLINNKLESGNISKITNTLQHLYTLNFLQLSNNGLTVQAADGIAAVINNNPLLQTVALGNNKLGTEGVITISNALKNINSLTVLSLNNNCITDKAANAIADIIHSNMKLEKLILNDNNLQSNGTKIICKSLSLGDIAILKVLLLQNNPITEKAADDLAGVIFHSVFLENFGVSNNKLKFVGMAKILQALKAHSHLTKVLSINNNHITDYAANDIVQMIANNSALEEVWLIDNKLDLKCISKITNALQCLSALEVLQLSNNGLTAQAADGIAAVIDSNPLLQTVALGNNELGTEGVITIANALKNINSLTVLSLNNNCITDKAANAIADVIHSNNELEELSLNDNNLQSNGTIIICESLLNTATLKVLLLQNNSITEEAADDLVAVIVNNPLLKNFGVSNNEIEFVGFAKVLQALKALPCLTKVLCFNNIQITDDPYAANDIAQVIANNSALEEVWLINSKVDWECINTITNALQHLHTLEHLRLSNNGITAQAADGIAAVINNNPLLQTVNLGNNKLQAEGVIKIGNVLKNIKHLQLLWLCNNCITDEAANAISDVIYSNTELEKLFLNDNNLQSNGIKIICKSLLNITTLKVLLLQNNSITEEAADDLSAVIMNNALLENFDVNYNKITSVGMAKIVKAIKGLSHLKVLSIYNNQITDNAANDIAQVIANNSALEEVWLINNKLELVDISKIINALQYLYTLKILQLNNNGITTQAADGIAAVINNNPLLQTVDLGNNKLKTEGVIKIAGALKNIRDIRILGLNNTCITDKAANAIADVIYRNTELEQLFLNDNNLQSNGTKIVCDSLLKIKTLKLLNLENNFITEEAGDHIGSVTIANPLLEMLILNRNNLASKGVIMICHALKLVHHLKCLCLHDNHITEEASDDIAEVIYVNHELEVISLSNNKFKFWCQGTHFDKSIKSSLFVKSNKLQNLFLGNCLLKSFEVTSIMCTLKKHTAIKELVLSYNYITNTRGVADSIAQAILSNCHMEKFYIACNRLQATGIITILRSLKQINSLKELSLGSNDITEDVSDDVVDVITRNTTLEVLDIGYTCMHSDGAVKVISALKSLSHLKILELPGNNICEATSDDIATVITNNINLARLYIADNYLGTVGITKITEILASPRGLEVLDLTNDNITSEAAESIAKVILANPSLESLLLGEGSSQLRNPIKPKELKIQSNLCDQIFMVKLNEVLLIQQMLRIKKTTKIYGSLHPLNSIIDASIDCSTAFVTSPDEFTYRSAHLLKSNYNSLQSDGIKQICKAFACVTSLKVVSIENNDVDDEAVNDVVAALTSNTGIKQLWIGENHFTPNGISIILQPLIQQQSMLDVLDLSYANLSSKETAENISKTLSGNECIQQLWLEGNSLSLQYIAIIVEGIKNCVNISVLNLRDNNISENAVSILLQGILNKSNLQQLYLGNNQLEDRGVIKITEALNTTRGLLILDLMNNNISEAAADALASVITSCRQLKQLYLGDNKLLSTGTIKIATAIQQAACRSTLRVLDLSNNVIGSDKRVTDEISRAVDNTKLLTVLILDDNALSVDGLLKITRSLGQSESAEYMMIFSVMHNDVMISEEAKDEMRAVMANQQLNDCVLYF